VGFDQVTTLGAAIRKSDNHMGVQSRFSVFKSESAGEGQDLDF
jgi:hypothetical protein